MEAIRLIEDLKVKQNQEMLKLLEHEQEEESEREVVMDNVEDQAEKKRLEKIFGMERAKAQARI